MWLAAKMTPVGAAITAMLVKLSLDWILAIVAQGIAGFWRGLRDVAVNIAFFYGLLFLLYYISMFMFGLGVWFL